MPDIFRQKIRRAQLVFRALAHAFALTVVLAPTTYAFAVESPPAKSQAALMTQGQGEQVKSFNEVLQDLVNEFSFDLRAKALNSLRNVAIRRVALGEGIPRTYESYLETQISDAFRKHSGTKVLQCTNCRVRRTVVENGRLVMTTPINNPQELDAIASQLGVEAWVDMTLIYQERSMILGFHVFDSKSKELLWSKLYNTENIYRQKMEQRDSETKQQIEVETAKKSKYLFATTIGWHLVPNVKDSANMLGINLRFSEKFNAGRDEVGTRLSGILAPSVLISDYPEIVGDPASSAEFKEGSNTEIILPFTRALGLYAIYGHFFSKDSSSVDGTVTGLELGAGTIVSKGYACFSLRGGATMRLGQRFLIDAGVGYSLPTTISVRNRYKYTTPGGLAADVAFGLQF
jgi:hypothetical protein